MQLRIRGYLKDGGTMMDNTGAKQFIPYIDYTTSATFSDGNSDTGDQISMATVMRNNILIIDNEYSEGTAEVKKNV